MTRINVDINPKALTDQHLFAEWREIKMVPKALKRSLKTKSVSEVLKDIPKKFCLNTGHVRHFYDKMKFLEDRYELLTAELIARNYQFNRDAKMDFDSISYVFFKDATYDLDDRKIAKQRILQRVGEKPTFYRYYSRQVSPEEYQLIIDPLI